MDAPYFGLKSLRNDGASPGFGELRQRLIAFVIGKIRNGEFTERGLARQIGVSQPQLHNVLKGVRVLKPELADALLNRLDITVLDLLSPRELNAARSALNRTAGWWTRYDAGTPQPLDSENALPRAPNRDREGVDIFTRAKPPRGEMQPHLRQKLGGRKLAS